MEGLTQELAEERKAHRETKALLKKAEEHAAEKEALYKKAMELYEMKAEVYEKTEKRAQKEVFSSLLFSFDPRLVLIAYALLRLRTRLW
jgi:ribosomal protein L20